MWSEDTLKHTQEPYKTYCRFKNTGGDFEEFSFDYTGVETKTGKGIKTALDQFNSAEPKSKSSEKK